MYDKENAAEAINTRKMADLLKKYCLVASIVEVGATDVSRQVPSMGELMLKLPKCRWDERVNPEDAMIALVAAQEIIGMPIMRVKACDDQLIPRELMNRFEPVSGHVSFTGPSVILLGEVNPNGRIDVDHAESNVSFGKKNNRVSEQLKRGRMIWTVVEFGKK